jgi:serine/threonine-protein kinase SRPK3
VFLTTGFPTIPTSEVTEEEHWPWYNPSTRSVIGNLLHSKYQVLYKLGHGTTATIWMCRDLHSVCLSLTVASHDEYVCLKSMVCDYTSVQHETKADKVLSKAAKTSEVIGKWHVMQALDHFELSQGDNQLSTERQEILHLHWSTPADI